MGTTTPGPGDLFTTTLLPWSAVTDVEEYNSFSIWSIYGYNFSNLSLLVTDDVGITEEEISIINENSVEEDALSVVQKNKNGTISNGADLAHLSGLTLWKGIPIGLVLVFLCLLTIAGNVLVLHAVRTERRLQTVSNLYIVSLAVADVIVGIVVMPISTFYIFTDSWMLGVAVCQIWMAVDYTASTASIFNLFILSLDRYWSVRQPLQYLHKRTKKRAMTFICVVWVASCLWILPIVGWNFIAHGGKRTVPNDVCDTEYAKNMPFKLVTAFFNFYLPLSIMYILYFKVFIEIRKRSQFEMGQRNTGGTVFSYKSNVGQLNASMKCNENNDDNHIKVNRRMLSLPGVRENGSRMFSTGCKNARLLSVKRINGPSSSNSLHESSKVSKVEYIYDENVIDPQTEKIERYFYEEHYPSTSIPRIIRTEEVEKSFPASSQYHSNPLSFTAHQSTSSLQQQCQSTTSNPSVLRPPSPKYSLAINQNAHLTPHTIQIPHNNVSKKRFFKRKGKKLFSTTGSHHKSKSGGRFSKHKHETSFSQPGFVDIAEAFSSSSDSTFDEKRSCDEREVTSTRRKPRESFSITSGIRKMRNGESLLERTTGSGIVHSSSTPETGSSGIGEDPEENRFRLRGGVLGMKNRMKTKRTSSSLKKEIKAARQLGVIMGAFTACFLPYFILFMVVSICDNCVDPGLLTAATWVGYLNSTLNPFLYPLCNANFRIKFKKMFRCCRKQAPLFPHGQLSRNDNTDRLRAGSSRYD